MDAADAVVVEDVEVAGVMVVVEVVVEVVVVEVVDDFKIAIASLMCL